MKKVNIRSLYSDHNPSDYGTDFKEESLTQQQFIEECDVNNILKKYNKTNFLNHVNTGTATYGDFSSVEEYQVSFNKIIEAQESFHNLPSDLRERFHNDPAKLIEFVGNKENKEEAIKIGLIKEVKKEIPLEDAIASAIIKTQKSSQ